MRQECVIVWSEWVSLFFNYVKQTFLIKSWILCFRWWRYHTDILLANFRNSYWVLKLRSSFLHLPLDLSNQNILHQNRIQFLLTFDQLKTFSIIKSIFLLSHIPVTLSLTTNKTLISIFDIIWINSHQYGIIIDIHLPFLRQIKQIFRTCLYLDLFPKMINWKLLLFIDLTK